MEVYNIDPRLATLFYTGFYSSVAVVCYISCNFTDTFFEYISS